MIRHEDTKLTKLFVGGIPYDTDDDSLRKFFAEFGEIKEAVVIRDRDTQKSKGYGFVSSLRCAVKQRWDFLSSHCLTKIPLSTGYVFR